MLLATCRGIIPSFVEIYAKSLGAQYEDGEISGEGWRAKGLYRKVRIGSLELTEAEMTFEEDAQSQRFLNQIQSHIVEELGLEAFDHPQAAGSLFQSLHQDDLITVSAFRHSICPKENV